VPFRVEGEEGKEGRGENDILSGRRRFEAVGGDLVMLPPPPQMTRGGGRGRGGECRGGGGERRGGGGERGGM